jgi:hypothetical protein
MRNFLYVCVLVGALAGWIFSLPAHAQTITGTIAGTVVDPSHAGVPGATVTLINQGTLAQRSMTSDAAGNFVFPAVLAGAVHRGG